jgi:hypothetical protein
MHIHLKYNFMLQLLSEREDSKDTCKNDNNNSIMLIMIITRNIF